MSRRSNPGATRADRPTPPKAARHMTQTVRIGGGSAGLGDGIVGIPQLLRGGELDYLVLDYLSEYFMPQAGRNRQRDPQAGYVPGFPDEIVALAGQDPAGKKVQRVRNSVA